VNVIDYKGTADWLLASILKSIADRLILYPNHRTKLLECFQEYEGCLSAAKSNNNGKKTKTKNNVKYLANVKSHTKLQRS